jgi:hypothetical protein
MLINRNRTIGAIVGVAALAASSLAAVSPAAAGWHGHGWGGPAIGFGAGVAVGPAFGAPYYGYEPYYGYQPDYAYEPYAYEPHAYAPPRYADADAYCASRFRSYDPYSHTYLGYDGFRHHCP